MNKILIFLFVFLFISEALNTDPIEIPSKVFPTGQVYYQEDVNVVKKQANYFVIKVKNAGDLKNNAIPGALYIANMIIPAPTQIKYYVSSTCSDACKKEDFTINPDATKNCWPNVPFSLVGNEKSIIIAQQNQKNIECDIAINVVSEEDTDFLFRISLYPLYRIADHYQQGDDPAKIDIAWGADYAPRYVDIALNHPLGDDHTNVHDITTLITVSDADNVKDTFIGTNDDEDACHATYFPKYGQGCETANFSDSGKRTFTFIKSHINNQNDTNIYAAIELRNAKTDQNKFDVKTYTITVFYKVNCNNKYDFDPVLKRCLQIDGKIPEKTFIQSETKKQYYYGTSVRPQKNVLTSFTIDAASQMYDSEAPVPGILYIIDHTSKLSQVIYEIKSTCNTKCPVDAKCPDNLIVKQDDVHYIKQNVQNKKCQITINFDFTHHDTAETYIILLFPLLLVDSVNTGSTTWTEPPIFWASYAPISLQIDFPLITSENIKTIKHRFAFKKTQEIQKLYIGTNNQNLNCNLFFPDEQETCQSGELQQDNFIYYIDFDRAPQENKPFILYLTMYVKKRTGSEDMLEFQTSHEVVCADNYLFDTTEKKCFLSTGVIPQKQFRDPSLLKLQYYYGAYIRPAEQKISTFTINIQQQASVFESAVPGTLYIIDKNKKIEDITFEIISNCNTKCPADGVTKCPAELTKINPDVMYMKQDVDNKACTINIKLNLVPLTLARTYALILFPLLLVDDFYITPDSWMTPTLFWSEKFAPIYLQIDYPFKSLNNIKTIKNTYKVKKIQSVEKIYVGSNNDKAPCNLKFPDENENCVYQTFIDDPNNYVIKFNSAPNTANKDFILYLAQYAKKNIGATSETLEFNIAFEVECDDASYIYLNTVARPHGCYKISTLCLAGQYYVVATQACEKCPEFCATCSSPTVCLSCLKHYKLQAQKCVSFSQKIFSSIVFLIGLFYIML